MSDGLYLYSTGPHERRDAQGSAVLVNGRIYATSEGQIFAGTFDLVDHRLSGTASLVYELEYGPAEMPHTVVFSGLVDGDSIMMECIPNQNENETYSAVLKRIE